MNTLLAILRPAVLPLLLLTAGTSPTHAHVIGDDRHDAIMARFTREFGAQVFAPAEPHGGSPPSPTATATIFEPFAPRVRVRAESEFIFVESDGQPAHNMMVGITAWQQQVPLPQPYVGNNAWRIPLHPRPSATPVSIRNRFLRGAIALAANGIPIFNPQNNRGEVSFDIGELDQWGGHCGRADDYHYHIAPLHLQEEIGPGRPIACALDGYLIHGLTEPDGTAPQKLDAFNGHETSALGYHYHASHTYPFVNGGFHGVVVEREEQVDPQPRAQGVRPALTALRGAKIVGFEGKPGASPSKLTYTVNGRPASVTYSDLGGGRWKFQFANADGTTREEIHQAGTRNGGGGGRDGKRKGGAAPNEKGPPREQEKKLSAAPDYTPPHSGRFALRSPSVGADGVLPVEYTGDGASISPPLEWGGAPEGTKSFAVIMHHLAPGNEVKWYWTLYNLPADTRALPRDARGIGTLGNNSVTRRAGYAPPHSKGPGEKTYVVTVYALAAPLRPAVPPDQVSRPVLLAAMKDVILDTAELKLTYTRPAGAADRDDNLQQKGNRK